MSRPQFYEAKDVTITIDGIEIGGGQSWAEFESCIEDANDRLKPSTYEMTMILEGGIPEHHFAPLFYQRGVTDAGLMRRALYGGRKGRSALRRLRAKGYNAWVELFGLAPIPVRRVRRALATKRRKPPDPPRGEPGGQERR
jgi:hypothetical protein